MTRQVRFRARARAELFAAQAWYEGRQAGLGGEFGIAVEAAIETVEGDDVVVLSFHHHRQDPAHRDVAP